MVTFNFTTYQTESISSVSAIDTEGTTAVVTLNSGETLTFIDYSSHTVEGGPGSVLPSDIELIRAIAS